jgi:phosphoglycolate phosphatase-like HAD superfamily hydrolase
VVTVTPSTGHADASPTGEAPSSEPFLSRYDVVVFDCDGVLLDSNDLKTAVFRAVLEAHDFSPATIEAFGAFQRANFGTSRYRLFQALVDGRFGEQRPVDLATFLADFGTRCRKGYVEQPETAGMRGALARAGQDRRPLYVVSGSDESELRDVFAERSLDAFFADVYGSPATKVENIVRVREHRRQHGGGDTERILFVGDAEADMKAAEESGADFVFVARYSTVREAMLAKAAERGHRVIEDLQSLI